MKYTRANRETVEPSFLRKQPDGHPGLSLNHTNSKFKVLAAWPAYLMIQSRLQHLFQMVRWVYWDTKGWRQLITILYTTNCKAVMREKPCALLKKCKICAKTKMSLLPKGKSWSSWPRDTTSMLPCNCFDLVCITYLWLLIIHGFFLYHIAVNEDSVSTRVGHMIKTKVNEVSFYLQLNLFKCRRQMVQGSMHVKAFIICVISHLNLIFLGLCFP